MNRKKVILAKIGMLIEIIPLAVEKVKYLAISGTNKFFQ